MPRRPVVLAVPGYESGAERLCARLAVEPGHAHVRAFPDGELFVRIDTPIEGREVVVVGALDRPADKLLPLYFLAATARDLGATRVGLVAPYLSFLRQDVRFNAGEGVTAQYFAQLISRAVDWLVTVDPHLHRLRSLDAIYGIPSRIARSAPAIGAWVRQHVERPLIVGPDAESEQWVSAVAEASDAPFLVLEKTRRGDRDVSVSSPDLAGHEGRTPVLMDDIISTGRTMIEAARSLARAGMTSPVCIGVHGVFADDAHAIMRAAGASRVVTCNTVPHHTNAICVWDAIAAATGGMLAGDAAA